MGCFLFFSLFFFFFFFYSAFYSPNNSTCTFHLPPSPEFEGTIPESLLNLPKLYDFRINKNQLTGQIPETRQGGVLELLYLDSNKLTGFIPPSLSLHKRCVGFAPVCLCFAPSLATLFALTSNGFSLSLSFHNRYSHCLNTLIVSIL